MENKPLYCTTAQFELLLDLIKKAGYKFESILTKDDLGIKD